MYITLLLPCIKNIYICFDDYTFSYLLGMAGGSPNEDSSEYPTIQSPGLGQRENDTVNVAKPHTI